MYINKIYIPVATQKEKSTRGPEPSMLIKFWHMTENAVNEIVGIQDRDKRECIHYLRLPLSNKDSVRTELAVYKWGEKDMENKQADVSTITAKGYCRAATRLGCNIHKKKYAGAER